MGADKKMLHSPKKINMLGRMRYSADMNAQDVINYGFDDCWRAIGWLYVLVATMAAVIFRNQLKKGLDKIENLLNAHEDINVI